MHKNKYFIHWYKRKRLSKNKIKRRLWENGKSRRTGAPQAHQQGFLIRNIDFPVFFKRAWSPGCARHRVTALKVCETIEMLHMLCVWGIRLLKVGNWGGGFLLCGRERSQRWNGAILNKRPFSLRNHVLGWFMERRIWREEYKAWGKMCRQNSVFCKIWKHCLVSWPSSAQPYHCSHLSLKILFCLRKLCPPSPTDDTHGLKVMCLLQWGISLCSLFPIRQRWCWPFKVFA